MNTCYVVAVDPAGFARVRLIPVACGSCSGAHCAREHRELVVRIPETCTETVAPGRWVAVTAPHRAVWHVVSRFLLLPAIISVVAFVLAGGSLSAALHAARVAATGLSSGYVPEVMALGAAIVAAAAVLGVAVWWSGRHPDVPVVRAVSDSPLHYPGYESS